MKSPKLEDAQAIATIFAAVAVPLVVALVGWQIQTSVSSEGVRKDYVQMAIGILSNQTSTEDASLRKWAVSVLEQNSPIPFGSDVRSDLERGVIVIQPRLLQQILNTSMMEPPEPWIKLPEKYTLDQLTDNYAENMRRSSHNELSLEYLQKAVKSGAEIESKSHPLGKSEQSEK